MMSDLMFVKHSRPTMKKFFTCVLNSAPGSSPVYVCPKISYFRPRKWPFPRILGEVGDNLAGAEHHGRSYVYKGTNFFGKKIYFGYVTSRDK